MMTSEIYLGKNMRHCDDSRVVHLPPGELVVHPKLIEIYGEKEDRPALEKSISEKGILESLKVSARTGVNLVLAGKCRLQIARKLEITRVKVEFVESGSFEEDLKLVLDFNLHREGGKTHYQKFHEGQYWESVLRPQAKERQRESARRLNQSNDSNLNHSINDSKSQLPKGKRVIREVSDNLNISVGSYHKGKKVFDLIYQLRSEEKFQAAVALEGEFNRSIDAAYRFLSDDRRNKVLDAIESGEVNSIKDGLAFVGTGFRNPWRKFEVGQVYQFKKEPRTDFFKEARVIKITDEFVVFAFRNSKTYALETLGMKPANINVTLQDEPSVRERERVYQLLEKFSHVYPLQMMFTAMLDITNFTLEEERILADFETGRYEEMVSKRKLEFEMMVNKEKTGDLCAA